MNCTSTKTPTPPSPNSNATRAGCSIEVNRWLDRLEADHGDRDLRLMAYLGGRFRIDVDNPKGDPWMILWTPHPDISRATPSSTTWGPSSASRDRA